MEIKMSRIGKYAGRIRDSIDNLVDSDWFSNTVLGTLCVTVALCMVAQTYFTIKARDPQPPVYRDVNGDGVEDKIVKRKVEIPGVLWTRQDTLEDEVLYGIEVNGKKLYLPKDQFEECKR